MPSTSAYGILQGDETEGAEFGGLDSQPEVLFLDEPLTGLDANAAAIFKELLKKAGGAGQTILFCSHILEVVERICTRILIINEGKRIMEGTAQEICRATERETLETGFRSADGSRDAGQVTSISWRLWRRSDAAALIEVLQVDYEQWRRPDAHGSETGPAHDTPGADPFPPGRQEPDALQAWISRLAIYIFMGGMLSPHGLDRKGCILFRTVILTYTMVMTAMLVLIDFSAVVVSPDDFAVLGYQPVTSRTYFITRLTNVLIYATIVTMALGLIPWACSSSPVVSIRCWDWRRVVHCC